MKKIALAMTVSVVALTASATAKDGFYMGVAGNYIQTDLQSTHLMTTGTFYAPANATAITNAPINDLSTNGYGATLFAGYGASIASGLTAGIEIDATVFDGEHERKVTAPYPGYGGGLGPFTYTASQYVSQQWQSTARLKLGVDLGFADAFVTGGAAFTDIEFGGNFSDAASVAACGGNTSCTPIPLQGAKGSGLKTGYVYGGGFDMALGGSTSLRVEYLRHSYPDLAYSRTLTRSVPFAGGTAPVYSGATSEISNDAIRIGLSWDLNL